METGVDDSDYKKEAKFAKSIMDQPNSNIKGLIVSIRPEEENGFDEWLEETTAMKVVDTEEYAMLCLMSFLELLCSK